MEPKDDRRCRDCKYFYDGTDGADTWRGFANSGPHCSDGPNDDASTCPDCEEAE